MEKVKIKWLANLGLLTAFIAASTIVVFIIRLLMHGLEFALDKIYLSLIVQPIFWFLWISLSKPFGGWVKDSDLE